MKLTTIYLCIVLGIVIGTFMMASFYNGSGTAVLKAQATLANAMPASDAVKIVQLSNANSQNATAEATRSDATGRMNLLFVALIAGLGIFLLVVFVVFSLVRPPWMHW